MKLYFMGKSTAVCLISASLLLSSGVALATSKNNNSKHSGSASIKAPPIVTPLTTTILQALQTAETTTGASTGTLSTVDMATILQYLVNTTSIEQQTIIDQDALISNQGTIVTEDNTTVRNVSAAANALVTASSIINGEIKTVNGALTQNITNTNDLIGMTQNNTANINRDYSFINDNFQATQTLAQSVDSDQLAIAQNQNQIVGNQLELANNEGQILQNQSTDRSDYITNQTQITQDQGAITTNQSLDQTDISSNQSTINEDQTLDSASINANQSLIDEDQALDQNQIADVSSNEGASFSSGSGNMYIDSPEASSVGTALLDLNKAQKDTTPTKKLTVQQNTNLIRLATGMLGDAVQARADVVVESNLSQKKQAPQMKALKTLIVTATKIDKAGKLDASDFTAFQTAVDKNAGLLGITSIDDNSVRDLTTKAKLLVRAVLKLKDSDIDHTINHLTDAMIQTYAALFASLEDGSNTRRSISLYNLLVSEHRILNKVEQKRSTMLSPKEKRAATHQLLSEQVMTDLHSNLLQPMTARSSMLNEEHVRAQSKVIVNAVNSARKPPRTR
jgi:hypothetical protein